AYANLVLTSSRRADDITSTLDENWHTLIHAATLALGELANRSRLVYSLGGSKRGCISRYVPVLLFQGPSLLSLRRLSSRIPQRVLRLELVMRHSVSPSLLHRFTHSHRWQNPLSTHIV